MTVSNGAGNAPKLHKVEALKEASGYLKQFLAEDLHNGLDHISDAAASVLKFHGSYQQDDRDQRRALQRAKKGKAYRFMVRLRLPGGRLTAEQYLVCEELARLAGDGTLRITTRQEFQFHGVLKQDLAVVMQHINENWLCTLAACGDVERNVLACPAPIKDGIRDQLVEDAQAWASHAAPRTSAYWDMWVNGERVETLPPAGPPLLPQTNDDPVEPIYGKTYLPRKFKTAFALPDDNCVDVHSNDLGYLAVVENGAIIGYNVLVGGGQGMTPSVAKTFPFLGVPICFVPRDQILAIGEAIVRVYRDFGNRSDRKRARIKYLLTDWGVPAFRAKVEEYLGRATADPRPVVATEVDDHLGWNEQGDGKLFLGVPVENGRIKDEGSLRLFSGLKAFFEKYKVPARLTCLQSILLTDIDPAWRDDVEAWLREYGIADVEAISSVRRWSMACPALPTCGLAITNAERALPSLIDELEAELARQGLADDRITVRMTGCPNGCARPYNADIGIVGRSLRLGSDGVPASELYAVFLGGRAIGDRLNVLYKDLVPRNQIVAELAPVFARYRAERSDGETFGEFCHRLGVEELAKDDAPAVV